MEMIDKITDPWNKYSRLNVEIKLFIPKKRAKLNPKDAITFSIARRRGRKSVVNAYPGTNM